jgi:hypothetical protein
MASYPKSWYCPCMAHNYPNPTKPKPASYAWDGHKHNPNTHRSTIIQAPFSSREGRLSLIATLSVHNSTNQHVPIGRIVHTCLKHFVRSPTSIYCTREPKGHVFQIDCRPQPSIRLKLSATRTMVSVLGLGVRMAWTLATGVVHLQQPRDFTISAQGCVGLR